MKYQNILQSFLRRRVNGVNLKMEAVSLESLLFFKKKHWIRQINLVFIHRNNDNNDDNTNNNNNKCLSLLREERGLAKRIRSLWSVIS